jgi:ABC-type uncharacterized transport system auxiliary subunit
MKTIVVSLLSSIFLISCSAERLVTKYYLIEPSSVSDSIPIKNYSNNIENNFSSEIRKFSVSKPYDQDRIVLRTKSNEINYYYYHKWAEAPSNSITFFLRDKIKQANIFSAFDFILYDVPVNYVVMGTVNQIERVDLNDNSAAHLRMKLELVEKETGKTILEHSFDRYSPINKNTSMNLFAREINKILSEETNFFIEIIYSNLQKLE